METIKKILIADDEPLNSYLFKEILRGLGYEILTASNGEEALRCIQKHIPDLVLLDIMMPTMTGLEILKKMSELQLMQEIHFIMVSAYNNQQVKRQAYRLGAEHFINKPVRREKLIRVVEDCLAG